jgi:integrase
MAGRVFKRGDTWHIAFSYKGTEYRKSSLTNKKREAEQLLAYYLGLCARGTFQGFEDSPTLSISEMLEDLLEDARQRQLRDLVTVGVKIKPMQQAWGAMPAANLTERHIDVYIKKRVALGRAPATINVEMQYLQQAFKIALRKKLVDKMPHVPRLKFSNARQGFFETEDVERVISFLPLHLHDVVRFAFLSGWRKKEITTLEWRDIQDGTIRLRPEISKNAEGRVLIVVGELAELVERRRGERLDLIPYVFHQQGKFIKQFYFYWRKACRLADVKGKLFHDLRRTAVRNMVRAGVPERTAMAISGHKTRTIFDRYNIVNEEDIRQGLLKTQAYVSQNERRSLRMRNTP